jgi:hypothetical protein
MRSIRSLLISATTCLFLAACQNDGVPSDPGASMPLAPRTPQQAQTDLRAVPLNVQAAFANDYPNATVTQTQVITPSAGPMSYKFVFLSDGRPVEAVYDYNGRLLRPAAVQTPARPGFPEGAPPAPVDSAAPPVLPGDAAPLTPLPRAAEGP